MPATGYGSQLSFVEVVTVLNKTLDSGTEPAVRCLQPLKTR